MNDLGNYLRHLRGKRSLREIAERTGLSHTYIADIENGVRRGTNKPLKPSPETLRKLSRALDVSYSDLMIKAGYWNKDDEVTKFLLEVNSKKEALEHKIIETIKKIVDDEGKFPAIYHREIFEIFGGYAEDSVVFERSSFSSRSKFDEWYKYDYLEIDPDDLTESIENEAIDEFNKFYNYTTIKRGIQNLDDNFIISNKSLEDFWDELRDFCRKNGINYAESTSSSVNEEEFIKSLELSDKEILDRFYITLDGEELSEEDLKSAIAFLRFRKQQKNSR